MKFKLLFLMMFVFSAFLASAQGGLSVEPNTNIKVETGTTLDISGGDLILESDALGDASLIDLGSVTYSGGGEARVERYLTEGVWHLISSPVSVATATIFLGDYLQFHTETTNAYTDIGSLNYGLNVMQGYGLWSMEVGATTEVFEGTTNTGEQQFLFTKNGLGFNLMGNPYPSAIDWDEVTIPANLNGGYYLWDPGMGDNGDYRYYIKDAGSANTTSQYIPSGQGFFTVATASGTFTVDNSVRTHGSQLFYKAETEQNMLLLKITGNDVTTQCAIRFIEEATPAIDRLFDMPKIISGNPDIPNLYSFAENREMAINTLPSIKEHEIVPLSFDAGMDGTYSILATELESIPEEFPVILEDVKQNYFQDLRLNPEYTFGYLTGEALAFKVHFKDVTSIESPAVDRNFTVNCFIANNVLHVDFLNSSANTIGATVSVYSVTGQLVLNRQILQEDNDLPFSGSQAIYIVNIITNEGNYSTKVFNH